MPAPLRRSTIAGYEITGVIMEGRNSTVYAAVDHSTRWEVAIKTVSRRSRRFRRRRRRLRWEFRVGGALHHPNIMRYVEFGQSWSLAWLVMDLVRGPNLRAMLRADAPLLHERPEAIIRQIVSALSYIHGCGVIHRDVKPENVLVAPTRDSVEVKLTDFAIAILYERRWRQWLRNLRHRHGLQGTKTYMSPEQIRRQRLDHRSDIYSLGLVMYEIAAGRPPFLDIDADRLMEAHLEEAPPPISRFQPEVNPAYEGLVDLMLKKDRTYRIADLDYVQKQLHEITVYREPAADHPRRAGGRTP